MNSKKFTALLLCVLTVLSLALFSCSEKGTDSTDSKPAEQSKDTESNQSEDPVASKYKDSEGRFWPAYSDNIKKEIIGDRTEFRVLVYDNTIQNTYYSEDIDPDKYENTDSRLKEALSTRNELLEDKTGVKIKAVFTEDVYNSIRKEIEGNINEFDAAMPFLSAAASLAQAGTFYDLNDFDKEGIIDLKAPWYDQNANNTFSVMNRMFFTVSDMSIMQKITSGAVTYNDKLIKEKFPDFDMYKMVKEKKWTLDKMYEIGKAFSGDADGDGVQDYTDTWGISAALNTPTIAYIAAGEHLCSKDENDVPMIAIGEGRSVSVARKALEVFQRKDWAIIAEEMQSMGCTENIWVVSLKIFGEGRAPFRDTAFSAIKKLRNYSVDYSIAPFPLIDEEQDDYVTPAPGGAAYGVVILSNRSEEDAKFSAYMIDAASALGKEYVAKAYYEQILKKKDALSDANKDIDMLDFIFDRLSYDIGAVYGFQGLSSIFPDLMKSKSTDIVSALEAIRDQVQVKIDEIVDNYSK